MIMLPIQKVSNDNVIMLPIQKVSNDNVTYTKSK